jgi:hypothetical protein
MPTLPLHGNSSSFLVACVFIAMGMCLRSCCLAIDACSGSALRFLGIMPVFLDENELAQQT